MMESHRKFVVSNGFNHRCWSFFWGKNVELRDWALQGGERLRDVAGMRRVLVDVSGSNDQ